MLLIRSFQQTNEIHLSYFFLTKAWSKCQPFDPWKCQFLGHNTRTTWPIWSRIRLIFELILIAFLGKKISGSTLNSKETDDKKYEFYFHEFDFFLPSTTLRRHSLIECAPITLWTMVFKPIFSRMTQKYICIKSHIRSKWALEECFF